MVLGILSFLTFVLAPFCAVAAIITGVKGKKAVDRSAGSRSGRGMAVAGEVMGIVSLALAAVFVSVLVVVGVAASKHTRYTSLNTGDCFNNISSNSVFSGEVNRLACSKPHDAEVTGSFQATDPGSYPGQAGFRTEAQPQCRALAVQYLGTGSGAGLQTLFLYPLQGSWISGTRLVVCAVSKIDGTKLTGSVRG